MTTREALFDQTMLCIERYASIIANSNPTSEILPKLQKEMEYYSHCKAKHKTLDDFLNKCLTDAEGAVTQQEAELIFESFENKIKSVEKMRKKADPRLLQFKRQCLNKSDDDIQVTQNAINTIDPISKLRMVDPVKNKKCGHHYEKKIVFELISKHPKTRCPIMGCSIPFISKSDLVADEELKRYLANTQSNAEIEKNSTLVSLDDTL